MSNIPFNLTIRKGIAGGIALSQKQFNGKVIHWGRGETERFFTYSRTATRQRVNKGQAHSHHIT